MTKARLLFFSAAFSLTSAEKFAAERQTLPFEAASERKRFFILKSNFLTHKSYISDICSPFSSAFMMFPAEGRVFVR